MIPTERAHFFIAAQTHKGMKEGKNNEDRYGVSTFRTSLQDATPHIFAIIADGIGGHLAGEVAAEMVVNHVSEAVAQSNALDPLEIMKDAVEGANKAVRALSEEDEEKQGMGATCVSAWIIGNQLFASSVGDSRLYLLRGAIIHQLTTDHTWIQEALDKGIITPEEARTHPNAHVIRQYVGGKNPPQVDFRLRLTSDNNEVGDPKRSNQGLKLQPGDRLLLCTDGLTDLVWNDEILEIVRSAKNLDSAAKRLIDTANQRGGHDNITVVLLSVPESGAPPKKISPWWIIGGILTAMVLLATIFAFILYITQSNGTPTPPPPTAIMAEPMEEEPTLSPFATPTPSPTISATLTPWPTSTP